MYHVSPYMHIDVIILILYSVLYREIKRCIDVVVELKYTFPYLFYSYCLFKLINNTCSNY